MGTRGHIAIRYKGVCYVFYHHMDSYYEGLGADIVKKLRVIDAATLALWRLVMDHLITNEFGEDSWSNLPTVELQQAADQICDILDENIKLQHTSSPCYDDNIRRFGLFSDIEFAYVICLDDEVFHTSFVGRYRHKSRWPISDIPDDWIDMADHGTVGTMGWVHKSTEEQIYNALCEEFSDVRLLQPYDGSVFLVRANDKNGVPCVVKVEGRDSASDSARELMVARELLREPKEHLVEVTDADWYNVDWYKVVMKCYEGDTSELETWDEATVVSLVNQVVKGLREFHAMGYIHHDVKPRNILFERVSNNTKKGVEEGERAEDAENTASHNFNFVLCDFEGACIPSRYSYSRWEHGWEEYKRTPEYLPEDYKTIPHWRIDYEMLAKSFQGLLPGKFFAAFQAVLQNRELSEEDQLVAEIEKLVEQKQSAN